MEVVGICGSDVHYLTKGRIGPFVVEKPMIIGKYPRKNVENVLEITNCKFQATKQLVKLLKQVRMLIS